jgi:hypothetical protein
MRNSRECRRKAAEMSKFSLIVGKSLRDEYIQMAAYWRQLAQEAAFMETLAAGDQAVA